PPTVPCRGSAGIDSGGGGATGVLASGSSDHATRVAARYRELGYRADVHTSQANGRTVHRVIVGQFDSFEEALRYRSDLPPRAPSDVGVLRLEEPLRPPRPPPPSARPPSPPRAARHPLPPP